MHASLCRMCVAEQDAKPDWHASATLTHVLHTSPASGNLTTGLGQCREAVHKPAFAGTPVWTRR